MAEAGDGKWICGRVTEEFRRSIESEYSEYTAHPDAGMREATIDLVMTLRTCVADGGTYSRMPS